MKYFDLVWTIPAQEELELIYEYHAIRSENAAWKIVETIFSKVHQLEKIPLSGPKEAFLKKQTKDITRLYIELKEA